MEKSFIKSARCRHQEVWRERFKKGAPLLVVTSMDISVLANEGDGTPPIHKRYCCRLYSPDKGDCVDGHPC